MTGPPRTSANRVDCACQCVADICARWAICTFFGPAVDPGQSWGHHLFMANPNKGPSWKPTSTGYELVGHTITATLTRGPRWTLKVAGQTHDLGKRASFDAADAIVLAA